MLKYNNCKMPHSEGGVSVACDELPENEWKREVHTYIDKQN